MMFEEVSLSEMYLLEYTTVQLVPIAPSFDLKMKIYLLPHKKSKQIPLFMYLFICSFYFLLPCLVT
jgi:hypothetical protein